MKSALMTLTRAGMDTSNVKVIGLWPYRNGYFTGGGSSEKIDTWANPKAENSRSNRASKDLQRHVAEVCGTDADNHTCAVIEYDGETISVMWSDCNTYVAHGEKIGTDPNEYNAKCLTPVPVLRDWLVIYNEYHAPEVRAYVLGGFSEKHGGKIQTSGIVHVRNDGKTVKTESGSMYRLQGPPSPEHTERFHGDVENPLKECEKVLDLQFRNKHRAVNSWY